jgi:hypothetical protein
MTGTCDTCKRDDVPKAVGAALIVCAHVDPDGNPCVDGGGDVCWPPAKHHGPLHDCTTHVINREATIEGGTVEEWQARNIAELDL